MGDVGKSSKYGTVIYRMYPHAKVAFFPASHTWPSDSIIRLPDHSASPTLLTLCCF